MIHCIGIPAERWLEDYVQGTLPEPEAQRFEEHYFDCPVCLSQVEALQAVVHQLGREPVQAPRKAVAWPIRRIGLLGAVAAVLLLGFLGYRRLGQRPANPVTTSGVPQPAAQPAAPAGSQLADLNLPAYLAPHLRGQSQESHFDVGMRAYSKGNCGKAITTLARVSAEDADARAARFYSGVCRLKLSQLEMAKADLRSVAEAGSSPEQEAALYYLAQTSLKEKDVAAARGYLTQAIGLHGDFEQRAQNELTAMGEKLQ